MLHALATTLVTHSPPCCSAGRRHLRVRATKDGVGGRLPWHPCHWRLTAHPCCTHALPLRRAATSQSARTTSAADCRWTACGRWRDRAGLKGRTCRLVLRSARWVRAGGGTSNGSTAITGGLGEGVLLTFACVHSGAGAGLRQCARACKPSALHLPLNPIAGERSWQRLRQPAQPKAAAGQEAVELATPAGRAPQGGGGAQLKGAGPRRASQSDRQRPGPCALPGSGSMSRWRRASLPCCC